MCKKNNIRSYLCICKKMRLPKSEEICVFFKLTKLEAVVEIGCFDGVCKVLMVWNSEESNQRTFDSSLIICEG